MVAVVEEADQAVLEPAALVEFMVAEGAVATVLPAVLPARVERVLRAL